MTSSNRAALIDDARRRIAKGSRSFRFASRLFDGATRERVWLLYSWCRACDDIADGQTLGRGNQGVGDPEAALASLRERTEAALLGQTTGDAPFDGLALVVRECGLPHRFVRDHLEGFAMDARDWRPQTLGDLLVYCYHVAGVVGCMMAVLMGVPPEEEDTLDRAADLGIAFQLANITRDISEDHAMGRCYLPTQWLKDRGIAPGDEMQPRHRAALADLIRGLTLLAGQYERSAKVGAQSLPFRSRWAVLAAAAIYGGIGREVARRGRGAWDDRVTIGKMRKLRMVFQAWRQARSPLVLFQDRWGLWTRGR
jgi:phytoene synthase